MRDSSCAIGDKFCRDILAVALGTHEVVSRVNPLEVFRCEVWEVGLDLFATFLHVGLGTGNTKDGVVFKLPVAHVPQHRRVLVR